VFCQFSTGIGNFGAVKGTDQSEAFFIHPNLTVTISTSSIIISSIISLKEVNGASFQEYY
jgi:hypothetical protein